MKPTATVFLDYKTGTSKTGRPYEILELSKDHRNFTADLHESVNRDVFKNLKSGDEVVIDSTISAGYDGRARVVITSISKVKS